MTETPKQERTQAAGAASDCNDLLEPLRAGAPRRITKVGPILLGAGIARDLVWATQTLDNKKRTEYLIGLHRVTKMAHGNKLTAIEFFAGPLVVICGWVGVGSNAD